MLALLTKLPMGQRWESSHSMSETRITVHEIALPVEGNCAGVSVCDFHYHAGAAYYPSGQRGASINFRHQHPHFEVFWIREGHGLIVRDFEEVEVWPRSLLIIGPGDIHEWRETSHLKGTLVAVSEVFTTTSNFALPFRELTAILQPNGTRTIALGDSEDEFIRNVMGIMKEAGASAAFDPQEVFKALLIILFSKIRGFHAGRGSVPETMMTGPLTQQFKQALITQCPRLVTVKEFADHLNVSRSYLHRSVLRDLGRSPSILIRDRIIFEAKRLLLHTSHSSAEISRLLGFGNASYFSSFFQRHVGKSPRAFRSRRVAEIVPLTRRD